MTDEIVIRNKTLSGTPAITRVNAHIGEGKTVEFESADDLFIFFSLMTSFEQVRKLYREVKHETLTTKQYHQFRAKTRRFSHILSTAKCSDGTPLLDAVKRKVNL